MKLSHLINLICVALIAGYIGAHIQKKKDLHEVKEFTEDFIESFNKEFCKKDSTKFQPEVIFKTRGEVEDVLSQLLTMMDIYSVVTIADLHDMLGKTSRFRDNQFGWTDLRNISIKWTRKGYLLDLPQAGLLH
jgi:hypothetical protein